MTPKPIHWVRDPEAIECLASPLRQRLLDRLEALGPSSVAELAASLDLPADGLYYHVRLLERRGLLVPRERRSTNGPPETVYDLVSPRWHIRYALDDERVTAALRKVTSAILRRAGRDFDEGLEAPGAVVSGARRNLWSLRLESRLGAGDVEAIHDHLQSILEILRRPGGGRGSKLCAVSWVMAPLHED